MSTDAQNSSPNPDLEDTNESKESIVTIGESKPESRHFCDYCGKRITREPGPRYKCQNCQDFDYCAACYADAHLIHPGHIFEAIDPESDGAPPNIEISDSEAPGHEDDHGPKTTGGPASDDPVRPKCHSCETITTLLPAHYFALQKKGLQGNLSLTWHLKLSRLVAATQMGCAFCAWMLDKFFGLDNFATWHYQPKKPWYADPGKHDKERLRVVNHVMTKLTKLKTDDFVFYVSPTSTRKGVVLPDFDKLEIGIFYKNTEEYQNMEEILKMKMFPNAGLQKREVAVFAVKDDPAAERITSRTPNPSPGSEQGMNLAREWVRKCEQEHGASCSPLSTCYLPDRVIDVSGGDHLRLYESGDKEIGKYCTLSYVWGTSQDFQMTKTTLEDRKAGFSITKLPKTLQDAIRVTQNLGIQYLWVDSMCIIQDSEVDKAHQIAHMSDIYKQAHVTICAARASDATEGFLSSWGDSDTGLWPSLVPLAYYLPNKEAKSLQEAMQMPRHAEGKIWLMEDLSLSSQIDDPISCRAWCLQESILSPRILHFGKWPIWRCNKGLHYDGGFATKGLEQHKLTHMLTRLKAGSAELFQINHLYQGWYQLLNDFTKRELSVGSDRLPAVGAIAQEMNRITGVDYLAGLWRNNLLHDAMWYFNGRDWLMRPEKWRAPSWSWASVDGPTSYSKITSDAIPLAKVLGCSVVPAPESSPFGEVQGGALEMRGPFSELDREDILRLFKEQNMLPPPPKSNVVEEWYAQMWEHSRNRPKGYFDDKKAETPLAENVFGIITFTREWLERFEEKREMTCYSGLLLRQVDGGKYERIGAFFNEDLEWLDQEVDPWEEHTVTIV